MSDREGYSRACSCLSALPKSSIPKLVVVDLDYTAWAGYCEFAKKGDEPQLFPEVAGLLAALHANGVQIGIASRTPAPDKARAFLDLLGWSSLAATTQIYPTAKTKHFNAIRSETGTSFRDMLFFDDEERNIEAVQALGVTSVLVEDGLTVDKLKEGLARFESQRLADQGF